MGELAERSARGGVTGKAPAPGVGLGPRLGMGAKVARFLKGIDRNDEPWEHKHHIFEKRIWCPHSRLPWCGRHGSSETPD
jgi:hypothetical protein